MALGVAPAVQAGAVPGPIEVNDRVKAHTTDIYTFTFRGGEPAKVLVIGDGRADLDLQVYDERGRLVAHDGPDDECLVMWTPHRTSVYTIKIVNDSDTSSRYLLLTN
jgi:hypothetical protein